jgi:hypothetical protein
LASLEKLVANANPIHNQFLEISSQLPRDVKRFILQMAFF